MDVLLDCSYGWGEEVKPASYYTEYRPDEHRIVGSIKSGGQIYPIVEDDQTASSLYSPTHETSPSEME